MNYEYKTVKVDDDTRTTDETINFVSAVEKTLNSYAKSGWEYVDNFYYLDHGSGRYIALIFRRGR